MGRLAISAAGALFIGLSGSCNAPATPDDRVDGVTSISAISAPEIASAARSAGVGTSAPSASSGPSSASTVSLNVADPKTFACGIQRCAVGKETCCDVSGQEREIRCVAAPAADPSITSPAQIFSIQCKVKSDLPRYTIVRRCDESQDCGAGGVCCSRADGELPFEAERCFPFTKPGQVVSKATMGPGPCPGREVCIIGGPPCRTPGASCVDGFAGPRCRKPPKSADNECDSTADCLEGQRCIKPTARRSRICEADVAQTFEPCTSDADCREFCVDARGRCTIFMGQLLPGPPPNPRPKGCQCN